jgi:hypothetical protein
MSNDEMIAEAQAAWHKELGEASCAGRQQYLRWIRSCGLQSLLYAIGVTAWKQHSSTSAGFPLSPLSQWKYVSSVAKRNSLELGFVRVLPESSAKERETVDEPAKQVYFDTPAGWLES